MKTSELTGARLDYWVARAEGLECSLECWMTQPPKPMACWLMKEGKPIYGPGPFAPSTNWTQGGPIIEREGICIWKDLYAGPALTPAWCAGFELDVESEDYGEDTGSWYSLQAKFAQRGPTPLEATMRCYVASKFGDEVPDA